MINKSPFKSIGDGVIGLGIKPEYVDFQRSYIFHLLKRFKRTQIGMVVLPNRNLSVPNNGLIAFGDKVVAGCSEYGYYDYTSLAYPFRQWIFTIKS